MLCLFIPWRRPCWVRGGAPSSGWNANYALGSVGAAAILNGVGDYAVGHRAAGEETMSNCVQRHLAAEIETADSDFFYLFRICC